MKIHDHDKKHQKVFMSRYHTFGMEFLMTDQLFLRTQLSLKSKTNTNVWIIGYLVYPQITQIVKSTFKNNNIC